MSVVAPVSGCGSPRQGGGSGCGDTGSAGALGESKASGAHSTAPDAGAAVRDSGVLGDGDEGRWESDSWASGDDVWTLEHERAPGAGDSARASTADEAWDLGKLCHAVNAVADEGDAQPQLAGLDAQPAVEDGDNGSAELAGLNWGLLGPILEEIAAEEQGHEASAGAPAKRVPPPLPPRPLRRRNGAAQDTSALPPAPSQSQLDDLLALATSLPPGALPPQLLPAPVEPTPGDGAQKMPRLRRLLPPPLLLLKKADQALNPEKMVKALESVQGTAAKQMQAKLAKCDLRVEALSLGGLAHLRPLTAATESLARALEQGAALGAPQERSAACAALRQFGRMDAAATPTTPPTSVLLAGGSPSAESEPASALQLELAQAGAADPREQAMVVARQQAAKALVMLLARLQAAATDMMISEGKCPESAAIAELELLRHALGHLICDHRDKTGKVSLVEGLHAANTGHRDLLVAALETTCHDNLDYLPLLRTVVTTEVAQSEALDNLFRAVGLLSSGLYNSLLRRLVAAVEAEGDASGPARVLPDFAPLMTKMQQVVGLANCEPKSEEIADETVEVVPKRAYPAWAEPVLAGLAATALRDLFGWQLPAEVGYVASLVAQLAAQRSRAEPTWARADRREVVEALAHRAGIVAAVNFLILRGAVPVLTMPWVWRPLWWSQLTDIQQLTLRRQLTRLGKVLQKAGSGQTYEATVPEYFFNQAFLEGGACAIGALRSWVERVIADHAHAGIEGYARMERRLAAGAGQGGAGQGGAGQVGAATDAATGAAVATDGTTVPVPPVPPMQVSAAVRDVQRLATLRERYGAVVGLEAGKAPTVEQLDHILELAARAQKEAKRHLGRSDSGSSGSMGSTASATSTGSVISTGSSGSQSGKRGWGRLRKGRKETGPVPVQTGELRDLARLLLAQQVGVDSVKADGPHIAEIETQLFSGLSRWLSLAEGLLKKGTPRKWVKELNALVVWYHGQRTEAQGVHGGASATGPDAVVVGGDRMRFAAAGEKLQAFQQTLLNAKKKHLGKEGTLPHLFLTILREDLLPKMVVRLGQLAHRVE